MNPRRRRLLREKFENDPTRREFLWKGACAALTATGIASTIWDLRGIRCAAADQLSASDPALTGDYKALVCVFLFGGNDGNNMLVPTDGSLGGPPYTGAYKQYVDARGAIAIPPPGQANGLIDLNVLDNTTGHTFGLHPSAPALGTLFNNGHAAFLCNCGTLLAPLTAQQYKNRSVAVPPQLFSHSDQQVEWQTGVEDQAPKTGWGGRVADLLYGLNSNNNVSMNISLAGANTFEVGNVIHEYNVSTSGAVSLNITGQTQSPAQLQALKDLIAMNHSNLYESAFADKVNTAIENAATLNAAIDSSREPANGGTWNWTTPFPTSSLGKQMKMIARLIKAAPLLGHNRQIFFASIGGFDLHATEGAFTGAQANLLADVSACMNALYMGCMQLDGKNLVTDAPGAITQGVTQFTASDFNRTFPANTDAGTDHAWGNHQIVVGGGVRGGRLYGTFPTLTVGGPDDTSTGRWIPTTAVEQYSATLAKWFGVNPANLTTVFPYLGRFSTPDLGFML